MQFSIFPAELVNIVCSYAYGLDQIYIFTTTDNNGVRSYRKTNRFNPQSCTDANCNCELKKSKIIYFESENYHILRPFVLPLISFKDFFKKYLDFPQMPVSCMASDRDIRKHTSYANSVRCLARKATKKYMWKPKLKLPRYQATIYYKDVHICERVINSSIKSMFSMLLEIL